MPAFSSSTNENPINKLANLASEIRGVVADLEPYAVTLDAESLSYVKTGSKNMMDSIHHLMRETILNEDDENPLLCRDTRHSLRNQLAIVKGFSDLMRMDLPESHEAGPALLGINQRALQFVEILDSARGMNEAPVSMAS